MTGIQCYTVDGSIRRICNSLRPNLEQKFLTIVGVFLDDAISTARKPYGILVINEAAVKSFRKNFSISPRVNDIPLGIKLNHRGRLMPSVQLILRKVPLVNDEHVILSICTYTSHRPSYPPIRQRSWPRGIDFVLGWVALPIQWQGTEPCEHEDQCRGTRGGCSVHIIICPTELRPSCARGCYFSSLFWNSGSL